LQHLHEATYSWYGTGSTSGGSHVAQSIPVGADYSVGSVSNPYNVWVEVKEDVFLEPEGTYLYQYSVNSLALGVNHPTGAIDVVGGNLGYEWLTSFKVPSGGAVGTPIDTQGWAFTDNGTTWDFVAPPGVGLDGGAAAFIVRTNLGWTISGGGSIDYLTTGGRQYLTGSDWLVSHPQVPEPGSMALLACGMVGLLPVLRRRRTV
jgi:hypothetical protein